MPEQTKGHGHVTPNADGSKARCGGPNLCSTCKAELARANPTPAQPEQTAHFKIQAPEPPSADSLDVIVKRLTDDARRGLGRLDHIGWNYRRMGHSEYWNLVGEMRADISAVLAELRRSSPTLEGGREQGNISEAVRAAARRLERALREKNGAARPYIMFSAVPEYDRVGNAVEHGLMDDMISVLDALRECWEEQQRTTSGRGE